jgi:biopolymer transport protein ExbD
MNMKCLLSVCLSVLTGIAIFAASKPGQTPALQKGISVQMAASTHAAPMPEADQENAWIVTVTIDGQIYFGTDPVTAEDLAEQMKTHPRDRDTKLYVKADAGAPFNSVRRVLHAANADLFDNVVLLTSQPEAGQPGTIVSPKGLDVWIGNETGPNSVAVQINSREGSSVVRVNNETIALPTLQSRLAHLFDNHAPRIAALRVSGQVSHANVVQVIDACHAAGVSRVSITVSSDI